MSTAITNATTTDEVADPETAPTTDAMLRHPGPGDGAEVWRLARGTGVLDVNPPYTYVMALHHFTETSVVAEDEQGVSGYVLGFRPPERPDALFVWQIAVAPRARKGGNATRMLDWLLDRHPEVESIEATVSPANDASNGFFRSLARRLGAEHRVEPHYGADLFPVEAGAHDPEHLHRIGPLSPR